MSLFHNNLFKTPLLVMSLLLALATLSACGGGGGGDDDDDDGDNSGGGTTFTIGGTVTGLTGTGLVLQNNSGDDLIISADGSFSFATALADASTYQVSVSTQPSSPSHTCTVSNGSGTVAGAAVSNVAVNCSTQHTSLNLTVSANQSKVLTFSWNDVGADHYKLLKNPDGASGYSQVGADITTTSVDETIGLHIQDWVNASYIVQACDALDACTDSAAITATTAMIGGIGYFKASNTGVANFFGYSIALSADGNTLAVGAYDEDSAATGINGNQSGDRDNRAGAAGAVYLFSRSGSSWSQQAYIKASNTGVRDYFGASVALSADGNTLAVGANEEDSAATGINGDDSDNSATFAGAVYLFSRSGSSWSQQAYIKASNTDAYEFFGERVALSADGNTLAVGAYAEDSAATGINGDDSDNTAKDAGAVYLFSRTGNSWSQQAYIKASNTNSDDRFGWSVALSADGNTLAVGAIWEDSVTTGINSDYSNNRAIRSGAVYLFSRTGSSWSQQAHIKASNTNEYDQFGTSVALSADGNTLAVGADYEHSAATGINGDDSDNSAVFSGAVYLFSRTGSSWSQQAYIKASNTGVEDYFGRNVALSADGNTLAVGAIREDSAATGINGDDSDNSASEAGAVYLFRRSGNSWTQQAYIKASNTEAGDEFGGSVALSTDGNTLAVGAHYEDSAATGINGDDSDNSENTAGAVYLY